MPDTLKCGTHGEREARFVCDHLFRNQRQPTPARMLYFEPDHPPDQPTPAIWCEACEVIVLEQGEINEVVDDFAAFHAVCDFCFQRFLDGNLRAAEIGGPAEEA
ncbi:MAG: hypothetical protein MUE46_11535 [Xanthomonadales bacterium]|jgi:hypothetical protein|nr:hypothetical protein [Xanthomonadales bacterium]